MRLTPKQYKTFKRMTKKLKTEPKFFKTNYLYLLRKYSYLNKSHNIVKCGELKFKKEKVIILFNQLKKCGPKRKVDDEKKKKYSKKSLKKCHIYIKNGKVYVQRRQQKQKLKVPVIPQVIKTNIKAASTEKSKIIQKKTDGSLETKNVRF